MTRSLPVGVRWAAAAAACVLALLSRGDVTALAVALLVTAWRPWALGAVVPALTAVAWRWGATSLEAVAGYQAVLGPAGWTGSGPRAASAWLGGAALVLATPRLARPRGTERSGAAPVAPDGDVAADVAHRGPDGRLRAPAVASPKAPVAGTRAGSVAAVGSDPGGRGSTGGSRGASALPNLLAAGAFGGTAALVAAGPGLGGDVWIRVVATLVGVASALGAVVVRDRAGRLVDGVAVASGLAALALVAASDPPSMAAAFDVPAARTGLAIGVAVAAATLAAGAAWGAKRHGRAGLSAVGRN